MIVIFYLHAVALYSSMSKEAYSHLEVQSFLIKHKINYPSELASTNLKSMMDLDKAGLLQDGSIIDVQYEMYFSLPFETFPHLEDQLDIGDEKWSSNVSKRQIAQIIAKEVGIKRNDIP